MITIVAQQGGGFTSDDMDLFGVPAYRSRDRVCAIEMEDDFEVVDPGGDAIVAGKPGHMLAFDRYDMASAMGAEAFLAQYEPIVQPGIDWSVQERKPRWFVGPYEGVVFQGCASCAPVHRMASMDTVVAVGFGDAHVSCNKVALYSESSGHGIAADVAARGITLEIFERIAATSPNADWRLVLNAPLRSREYQRHGPGKWVLIASGEGFA